MQVLTLSYFNLEWASLAIRASVVKVFRIGFYFNIKWGCPSKIGASLSSRTCLKIRHTSETGVMEVASNWRGGGGRHISITSQFTLIKSYNKKTHLYFMKNITSSKYKFTNAIQCLILHNICPLAINLGGQWPPDTPLLSSLRKFFLNKTTFLTFRVILDSGRQHQICTAQYKLALN